MDIDKFIENERKRIQDIKENKKQEDFGDNDTMQMVVENLQNDYEFPIEKRIQAMLALIQEVEEENKNNQGGNKNG